MDSAVPPLLVGGGVFNLLTTGMYDTPLAVYREYIQNSSDAIQSSKNQANGRIEICIDPMMRCVTIRDNGPGLSRRAVEGDLIAVGQSRKQRGSDRGFRGIGRLAGLAFADSVAFRTRSSSSEQVVELVWDGNALRKHAVQDGVSPNEIVEGCVEISNLSGSDWPDHFFEVQIRNVARHAAGEILNRDIVRSYIAEVCPVPMADDFPFTSRIVELFNAGCSHLMTLDILLDDSQQPIVRPFRDALVVSDVAKAPFTEFQSFTVPAVDGEEPAAIGWLAHSDYFGAIPKGLSVRGLRAREGNLQIGDERVFDHLFPEERFNRWCVGEVHVADPRIMPNGRRDYFEPGPHTRNLENQLEAIARGVSERCRTASTGRHRNRKLLAAVEQMETVYELAVGGYLKAPDARVLVHGALERLGEIYGKSSNLEGWTADQRSKFEDLDGKLKAFRPKRGKPAFGSVRPSEICTYQKIFRALTETSPTPEIAMRTIQGVLASA